MAAIVFMMLGPAYAASANTVPVDRRLACANRDTAGDSRCSTGGSKPVRQESSSDSRCKRDRSSGCCKSRSTGTRIPDSPNTRPLLPEVQTIREAQGS